MPQRFWGKQTHPIGIHRFLKIKRKIRGHIFHSTPINYISVGLEVSVVPTVGVFHPEANGRGRVQHQTHTEIAQGGVTVVLPYLFIVFLAVGPDAASSGCERVLTRVCEGQWVNSVYYITPFLSRCAETCLHSF